MSTSPGDQETALALTAASGLLTRLNHICQKFAEAWQSGQCPQIEDYLKDVAEAERADLLRELIQEEIELRKESSNQISVDQYIHRFPAYYNVVVSAFAFQGHPGDVHVFDNSNDSLIPQTIDISPTVARENLTLADSQRYRKIRLLGEGGFGQVWLAEDLDLHRQVAFKEPHHEHLVNSNGPDNFLNEARTLAGLDHPNIVPVYDTGRSSTGHFFVVSKVIDGPSLSEKMKQGKLSISDIVSIVSQIADALHYAHGKQIVHRDVKPDNILFDSSGKPWLSDFGIALHDDKVGTGSQIIGTPAYMSPEQVSGSSHRVDGRTDIYSLGVILYELLTGRRPFRSEKQVELLEQIRTMDAKPLRQIDDTIPRELERICLKALSRFLPDRYLTAKDFADELRAILEDQHQRAVLPTFSRSRTRPAIMSASFQSMGCSVMLAFGILLMVATYRIWFPEQATKRDGYEVLHYDDTSEGENDEQMNLEPELFEAPIVDEGSTNPQSFIRFFEILASRNKQPFRRAENLVPLRSGDHIRFAIEFSQPVFARLIWVDADGRPVELFPSDPSAGLRGTAPVTRIESPIELDTGWPVEGNSGMETAVLLISKTPLDTVPLELLTMKPRDSLDNLSIATYFASRDVTPSRTASDKNGKRETRGLGPAPGKVDDPVMSLLESLRQHADVVQAISLLHSDEPLP